MEFYYQKFLINQNVLIPRLETESLVREAIKYCRMSLPDILIDIGTGSGIITLSILSAVEIPQIFALDISSEALEIAKENNQKQGKNITFIKSDLLGSSLEKDNSIIEKNKNILIVTNLPYIKQDDWENMSSDTVYEPKLAFFGGEKTGFELYEKLFDQINDFIEKYQPKTLIILAEMGDDQNDIAIETLTEHEWRFSFFSDLR